MRALEAPDLALSIVSAKSQDHMDLQANDCDVNQ